MFAVGYTAAGEDGGTSRFVNAATRSSVPGRARRRAMARYVNAWNQVAGAVRGRASVAAIQMPAKTAATPSTRLRPKGSPRIRAASTPAARGLTVIVAVTRVGV